MTSAQIQSEGKGEAEAVFRVRFNLPIGEIVPLR
jgi:hypothetical protein